MNIAVSIVEDDPQVRSSLAKLIDSSPGYRCVSRHGNAEDSLDRLVFLGADEIEPDGAVGHLFAGDDVAAFKRMAVGDVRREHEQLGCLPREGL